MLLNEMIQELGSVGSSVMESNGGLRIAGHVCAWDSSFLFGERLVKNDSGFRRLNVRVRRRRSRFLFVLFWLRGILAVRGQIRLIFVIR